MPNLPGIILAGGRATRMGGGDKGLRVVAGTRLIDHVIARLAAQCAPLAINANGDPARLAEFGLPILPDSLPDHPGPLAGVLAGLDWAASLGAPAIITAAADTPFFPQTLPRSLSPTLAPRASALPPAPTHRASCTANPPLAFGPPRCAMICARPYTAGCAKLCYGPTATMQAPPFFPATRLIPSSTSTRRTILPRPKH